MTTTATDVASTELASRDLTGLGPDELLACVVDAEAAERRAGLAKLDLALQWCLTHPAASDTEAAVWSDGGLPGLTDYDDTLGGPGAPLVAAFAAEPFAAALGVSTWAGMQLLADALDLAYRLPQTWARVRGLEVPAWKARRLAQATHHLPEEAARFVDARVADRLDTGGSRLVDRAIAQATARFDPPAHATAEDAQRDAWDVTLHHPTGPEGGYAATSHLHAIGDTLDLTRLFDLVCDHAAHLARLGDTDPLGARKTKALTSLADTQTTLDLADDGSDPGDRHSAGPVPRPSLAKTRLYLHLSLADLLHLEDHDHDQDHDHDPRSVIGEVERLGPATLARIRDWVAGSRATIVPVLHLTHAESQRKTEPAVDQHDPPETMRETVILRDPHCVFPWCTHTARACDLDHIDPYIPLDQGGPPGQTRPTNLAPLCRRHHNAKTTRRWTYLRNPDGTYTWHDAHRRAYLVSRSGTRSLDT